ncbi:MAG: hypothetical protein GX660_23970 [Clostridiaceae bacterium]|nr:hypothetical protein [Clostridiaceae bacterium]
MDSKVTKRNILISASISILFLLILRTRPVWERYPGGNWNNIYYVTLIVLFIWIFVKIILEVVRVIKWKMEKKTIKSLVILIVVLFFSIANPFNIDLDFIYGKVKFKACYEGTMNGATLKIREENKFDLHWYGAFGYDEFFIGNYEINGDTLWLYYLSNRPSRFGSKILMDSDNELLITLRGDTDSLENVVDFYYGDCKGLN